MSRKTNHKAVAKLAALYARLPTVACKGQCFEACGPIPMSRLECERMRKADPQRRLPMIDDAATCGYLTAARRCAIYAARPLICRVYGTLKRMSCPHGCVPDRWLSDAEFIEIAQAVERLSGGGIVVSTPAGPVETAERMADVPTVSGYSPAQEERIATHTHALRALHGGRIFGLADLGPDAPKWIRVHKDEP